MEAIKNCIFYVLFFTICACSAQSSQEGWVCNNKWFQKTEGVYRPPIWRFFLRIPDHIVVTKIRIIPDPTCLLLADFPGSQVTDFKPFTWKPDKLRKSMATFTGKPGKHWMHLQIENLTYISTGAWEYDLPPTRAPFWFLSYKVNYFVRGCPPTIMTYVKSDKPIPDKVRCGELEIPEPIKIVAPKGDRCDRVTKVPLRVAKRLKLDLKFYRKYTSAYGIPVMSSDLLKDEVLQRACYILRFMVADRPDVRSGIAKEGGRIVILAKSQNITKVPELSDFKGKTNGLYFRNIVLTWEQYMMCPSWYRGHYDFDVLIHELSHMIHHYTAERDAIFRSQQLHNFAKSIGKWENSYAGVNHLEYFAVGTQIYFSATGYKKPPRIIIKSIETKEKLRKYDPPLYKMLEDMFPCGNKLVTSCQKDWLQKSLRQKLRFDCN